MTVFDSVGSGAARARACVCVCESILNNLPGIGAKIDLLSEFENYYYIENKCNSVFAPICPIKLTVYVGRFIYIMT